MLKGVQFLFLFLLVGNAQGEAMTMPEEIAKKRDALAEVYVNAHPYLEGLDGSDLFKAHQKGFDAAWELVEEAKRQAREDEEASAVSFDWISTATDLKEIQEYARNCAYLIRTGTLPPEPKGAP